MNRNISNSIKQYLYSWKYVDESFSQSWNYLKNLAADFNSNENGGETIWQTKFKEVQIIDVPINDNEKIKIAFKNYHEKRFFRYFLRPSLAAREAKGYEIVESLGIPVVKVLAYGENRKFFNLVDAFFITKFAENCKTFLDFTNNLNLENKDILLQLLNENIKRLALLHKAGYTHGGAHPRNFLWIENDDQIESIWLDLATVRKMNKINWKYLLTDLSDFTEYFHLTQEELDNLIQEYRSVFDIPVAYKLRTDSNRKFSCAVKL
jgi:tRNA A-37 threonylcarbamoyl transferase component Bud32